MVILYSGLAAGAVITITYGDGAGVTAQGSPGTAVFNVSMNDNGDTTYPLLVMASVEVLDPTPTATGTETDTITETNTASPTFTITETHTASPTITETITPTYTVTMTATPTETSTPAVTPLAPAGLTVNQNGAMTDISWNTGAAADYYRIYSATGWQGKFNAWGTWSVIATVLPTPVTSSYSYDASGEDYRYYIVTGVNATGESDRSSMGARVRMNFAYTAGLRNTYRLSVPYVSKYTRASDIITSIEGSLLVPPVKTDNLAYWNPYIQAFVSYRYVSGWKPPNFFLEAGSTSSNALFLNALSAFDWVVAGTDRDAELVFAVNPAGKQNANKRMMPYTSNYRKASDIVKEIEGGTGLGRNVYINKVAVWSPSTQSYRAYLYNGVKWVAPDPDILPGDSINIYPSGNTASFTWIPRLVVTPVP
jgi:hypothetical protein